MKATVEQHIKFKKLKMRLKMPMWMVKGVLESLWNFTAQHTPDGRIGTFSNEDVCACLEWEDDPDALIDNLTACGWLEVGSDCRLIIHDWEEHCPRYVKGNIVKQKKSFATPYVTPNEPRKEVRNETPNEQRKDSPTKPSQAKPSQAKPLTSTVTQSATIAEVFDFWRFTMKHAKAQLDKQRTKLIATATKMGYSIDDLKHAVTGCSMSEWHMGKNDRSTRYDSLRVILKDADQIDKFIGIHNQGGAKAGREAELDNISNQAIQEWLGESNVIDISEVQHG